MVATEYMTEQEDCLQAIYNKYSQTVYKYILVSLDFNESYADDCMQDVYLAVCIKKDTVIEHPNPGGFIIVTARNFVKKYRAKMQKSAMHTVALDETVANTLTYEVNFNEFMDNSVDIDNLKKQFLGMLSEKDLYLYSMFYEKKYSVAKISTILKITESNVKVRLFRLRLTVKEHVKKAFTSNLY